jgi:hypothetical protein
MENGGSAASGKYLSDHYHQPSDDVSQAIVWSAGARFAEVNSCVAERSPMLMRTRQVGRRRLFRQSVRAESAESCESGQSASSLKAGRTRRHRI